jgi:hypothetical protein
VISAAKDVDRDGLPSDEIRDGLFLYKKVIFVRIAEHLSQKQKKQLDKLKSPKNKKENKPKKKKEEKINWHEMMGSNNRGLYRGKGGALKKR